MKAFPLVPIFRKTVIATAFLYAATHGATASSEPTEEIQSQLDFWIGTWEVRWTDSDGVEQSGVNTVARILDGRVVRESFDAREAIGLEGKSYSVYDRHSLQWKQTWVDNSGNYMDFTGRADGDRFIFERRWTRGDGAEIENRMIFRDISDDSFVWDWEGRLAGTDEWKLLWQLHYHRME